MPTWELTFSSSLNSSCKKTADSLGMTADEFTRYSVISFLEKFDTNKPTPGNHSNPNNIDVEVSENLDKRCEKVAEILGMDKQEFIACAIAIFTERMTIKRSKDRYAINHEGKSYNLIIDSGKESAKLVEEEEGV